MAQKKKNGGNKKGEKEVLSKEEKVTKDDDNDDEKEETPPELDSSEDEGSDDNEGVDDASGSVYDSEDGLQYEEGDGDDDDEEASDDDNDDDDSDEDFEDQGSSDEDDDLLEKQANDSNDDGSEDGIVINYEKEGRAWPKNKKRSANSNIAKNNPSDGGAGGAAAASGTSGDAAADGAATTETANVKVDKEKAAEWMHADDWSSDDDDQDGTGNRIGRVPLHWYEEYDHIGYDVHGERVMKSASLNEGDRLDRALANEDAKETGKFTVYDALNDRTVELTARQLEMIRRVQNGAVAHAEHDANPDYIDYFSGVDPEIMPLSGEQYEPKRRFQPSKYEQIMVDRMLQNLEKGYINMDYLTGKIRDMNDVQKKVRDDSDKPFMLWTGNEEDELNLRKGPQHIAAPKVPPPGHAESYIPPDEYLPTEEELEKWKEMEPKDRPHGYLIPKKHPNLRSLGAYRFAVKEAFDRCLDLYLCPRVMKRRLNIDPESLVPQLPKASDLKPFPTAKCIEYKTPWDETKSNNPPIIRCVTASPDGQFMASGASDGYVRLWEVQTGRLLRSWNVSKVALAAEESGGEDEKKDDDKEKEEETNEGTGEETTDDKTKKPITPTIKPVVALEWNPNHSHHCLLAAVGCCIIVIATGTAGVNDAELTAALLLSASQGGNLASINRASKAVQWQAVVVKKSKDGHAVSSHDTSCGPVCALKTKLDIASVRWQAKGDYFVSVSPKAGAAAVLIHQLSKGNTQQPFSKAKGQAQCALFHPSKPFLFVASQQHVRIYHLTKQSMVKRLLSGAKWISTMDIHHASGDHLIVGTLDRRMIWFDLDLGATPYKTLKYHEKAIRSCSFHRRYPLMASSADDGAVHVFHSTVYNDLMRNPLIVPVKILRGHDVVKGYGVLSIVYHPTQPWIFTAGADGKLLLWQDI